MKNNNFSSLLKQGQKTENAVYEWFASLGANVRHYSDEEQINHKGENDYHIEIKSNTYDDYLVINISNYYSLNDSWIPNGLYRQDNTEWVLWYNVATKSARMVRKAELIDAIESMRAAKDTLGYRYEHLNMYNMTKYYKLHTTVNGQCQIMTYCGLWETIPNVRVYNELEIAQMVKTQELCKKDQ